MKLLSLLLLTISFGAFGFTPVTSWIACEEGRCEQVTSGDDLYLKHNFKTDRAIYKTTLDAKDIKSCIQGNDCWLYLGPVGDTATVKLNNVIIGKFEKYIHFESLKFHIPTSLITEQNELSVEVTELNQTRFGLRSTDIGIGSYSEVDSKSNIDWLLRTGSPLLSAFTLFVLLLGLLATYSVYRNSNIIPLLGLSFISVLYLLSFSEFPRQWVDAIYASGPIHFVLRLMLDLSLVLVALSLYRPHQKIAFLTKLPFLYIVPITIMAMAGLIGVHEYAFYQTTMLIVAPLVVGGGFAFTILSYYYFELKERQLVFPMFLGLFAFQIYDLLVFWELVSGTYTVKWYLPFLVISFAWIYVRRRIFEVRTLKIDALVGDEVRKLAHDLAAPIKNLSSLAGTNEHDLIARNVKDLESITNQVLGKYNNGSSGCVNTQDNIISILLDVQKKFQDRISISFDFSMEFDWYCVDATLFMRVFTNLVSNSIKANASEVKIHGSRRNNFLTIDVSDNGNGIPKKFQPYIFDKGITSDNLNGNGLGLSFIKEKFSELGFSITLLKSSPAETVIQILFPLKVIVLIDDNPLVRDTWMALAKKAGIQIKAYARSKDFEFRQISKTTPIFVDHKLGEENGLKVAQKLLNLGFKNVALATGETAQIHPQVRQVGKGFPSSYLSSVKGNI